MWPVVKDSCDNACWLVVLVRCRASGRVLAYCRDCGGAWPSLEELRVNDFAIGSEICPEGIEVPSQEEVARSSWAGVVQEFVPEAEYSTASEINDALARERATALSTPTPQRPYAAGLASCSRWWFGIVGILASWFPPRSGSTWYRGPGSMIDLLRRARERAERDA